MKKIFVTIAFVIIMGGSMPPQVSAQAAEGVSPTVAVAVLPDGTLAREVSFPKVYYLQNGTKRWIDSGSAFLGQGFRWTDIVVVGDGDLDLFSEGETITTTTATGLSFQTSTLPDLTPFAPYDTRYVVQSGRTLLKFTATFWNRGKGAIELNADARGIQGDGDLNAAQRVFRADGTSWDRPVGTLFWHAVHAHYHYNDFGEYRLELVRPAADATPAAKVVTQKTTFCMRDDTVIRVPAEAARQAYTYNGCTGHRQGLSVGWADVYLSTLPDQYFDVTGLPAGLYRLSFNVDPKHHFLESRRDNNVSSTFLEIDPAKRTLTVVAAASPFTTTENFFPNGMLVRAEGDPEVSIIRENKKRHLRTESVFLSYGLAWNSVIVLPKTVVDAIPRDLLVRVKGTSAVYRINDAGYRRRLLSPSVLRSYGSDFAEINQTELDGYQESALIMREGEQDVYLIEGSGKRLIGTRESLPALGYDPASVQVVTDVDFNAYALPGAPVVIAENLTVPWEIVFLPDGDILVTERSGTLRRIGKASAIITVPDVLDTGEGGLMGMALHPQFAQNQLLYLYFTTSEGGQHNRVSRFRLDGNALRDEKIIIDGIPSAIYHDGGRIAFGPDGMLYITTGDATDSANAQDLGSLAGKTLRLTAEGDIPSDNPFGTAIWSYGHRNAQGLAWDNLGRLWETEHGRSGATSGYDELNLVERGKNYGWPTIQGPATREGMVSPARQSGPDVTWAPAGIAFADGKLFFAGLLGSSLYEATIDAAGTVTSLQSNLVGTYGRLRAVVVGPDGYLYLTTSNRDGRGTVRVGDDKILKVHPEYFRN